MSNNPDQAFWDRVNAIINTPVQYDSLDQGSQSGGPGARSGPGRSGSGPPGAGAERRSASVRPAFGIRQRASWASEGRRRWLVLMLSNVSNGRQYVYLSHTRTAIWARDKERQCSVSARPLESAEHSRCGSAGRRPAAGSSFVPRGSTRLTPTFYLSLSPSLAPGLLPV